MGQIKYLIVFLSCLVISCQVIEEEQAQPDSIGISENEIRIGTSSALSGHAGFLGSQYLHGALAYINEVNNNGGIHGRKLRITSLDDQYNPAKTIANTQELIHEKKVFALFNYVGTPTSVAVKPIIEAAQIPIFGFFTGAEKLRKPHSRYIFHLRDSYFAEAEGAVAYFVDRLGLQKIAVFYQEDAFGTAVLTGVQIALRKRGLEPVVTDTYIRGSMDIQDSVERINKAEIDVVMMVGTYSPLAKFIKMTHQLNTFPLFSTVSFVGSEAYAKELIETQNISVDHYQDILVTQVVPSPLSTRYTVAKEYLKLSGKYFPDAPPNYVAFEGFLNARIFIHALEMAGRDVNRSKLIESLQEISDYDLGIEKKINYGPDDQEGIKGIYYSQLTSQGRFEIMKFE